MEPAKGSSSQVGRGGLPPSWAERLAHRRRQAHDTMVAAGSKAQDWIPGAVLALWSMVDDAVKQANDALEHDGLSDRIVTRQTAHEYWLGMPGPDGSQRYIAVFVSLRPVDGHASGGGQVTTSETRAIIHLEPRITGGRLRWMIHPAAVELTSRIIDDLLLCVFGDDPAAEGRLRPYYTL